MCSAHGQSFRHQCGRVSEREQDGVGHNCRSSGWLRPESLWAITLPHISSEQCSQSLCHHRVYGRHRLTAVLVRLSKEGRSPKKQLWVFIFDWRSILFLTTSSWRLFLAPGEKVTSFFDLVLIIGLSVSGGGEKTMLMRSGVQCPRGSFNCPFVLWPKVYILYLCPATVMTIEIGREGENVETL